MVIRTVASMCVVAGLAAHADAYFQYSMTQAGFSPTFAQYTALQTGFGGSGISYGQTTGGNPLEHRRFETANAAPTLGQDYTAYAVSLLFAGPYDPTTQGAISQLTYREDFRTEISVQTSGPIVRQGGNFYLAPVLTVSASNWTSSNLLTLTASDFFLFTASTSLSQGLDPNINPDFSATASPLEFGVFRSSNSGPVPGGGADSAIGYMDNAFITIPAPATGFTALILAAATSRRRRPRG